MVPSLDGYKYTRATSDIRTHIRFSPSTCTVTYIFPVQVDTIKRVRGSSKTNTINIIHGHLTRFESHVSSFPCEFFGCFLGAPDKFCHTSTNNGYFSHSHFGILSSLRAPGLRHWLWALHATIVPDRCSHLPLGECQLHLATGEQFREHGLNRLLRADFPS